MAENKSKNLPSFKSTDELVAFFESHDMAEYWEQMTEAEVEVNLTKKVTVRNPRWSRTKSRKTSSSNTGKRWTPMQLRQLRQLASKNLPTRVIGLKLGRTENAVRTKASQKGVSLRLKSQSSYYRRKKQNI
jgi:hypothetical protein